MMSCQTCGREVNLQEKCCPTCGPGSKLIHYRIKEFLESNTAFHPSWIFRSEKKILTGIGEDHLSQGGYLQLAPGIVGLLAGRVLPYAASIGGVLLAIAILRILHSVVKKDKKYFVIDFESNPPTWETNDDHYWRKPKEFFFNHRIAAPQTHTPTKPSTDSAGLKEKMGHFLDILPRLALVIFGISIAVALIYTALGFGDTALSRMTLNFIDDSEAFAVETFSMLTDNPNPKYSRRLLTRAAGKGDLERIKTYVSQGANINTKDRMNRTILSEAAENNQEELLDFALSKGARANTVDANGRTPLHGAASHCNTQAVQTLLANGADPSLQDSSGLTAMDIAERCNESPIKDTFKKFDMNYNLGPIAPNDIPQALQTGEAIDFSDFLFPQPNTRVILHSVGADGRNFFQEFRSDKTSETVYRMFISHPSFEDRQKHEEIFFKLAATEIIPDGQSSHPRFVRKYERLGDGSRITSLKSSLTAPWGEIAPCIVTESIEPKKDLNIQEYYCKGLGKTYRKVVNSLGEVTEEWRMNAQLLLNGKEDFPAVPYNYEDSIESLLCPKGNGESCTRHGVFLEASGKTQEAKTSYALACQFGHATGCLNEAFLDYRAKNTAEARSEFQSACTKGLSLGCIWEKSLLEEAITKSKL